LKRKKEEKREKAKLKTGKVKSGIGEPKKKRRKEKRVTSAAAESSTDKRKKENFKLSIANTVVNFLNQYRKPECTKARITNNEDFKHLARRVSVHFYNLKKVGKCFPNSLITRYYNWCDIVLIFISS